MEAAYPFSGLSIVIPLHDEQDNVAPLAEELLAALRGLPADTRVVLVDDGSGDLTGKRVDALASRHAGVFAALHLSRCCGQSAAILAGVLAARTSHVATLDGDLQNDPRDLIPMLAHLREADAVLGRRSERRDSHSRRWAGRLANAVRRGVLRDPGTDSGCSLRIFPREAFLRLPAFDGMHRFLPALFQGAGLRLREIDVGHRPRHSGRTKYTNFGRLLRTLPDLFGVWWLAHRAIPTCGPRALEAATRDRAIDTGPAADRGCSGTAGAPRSSVRGAFG